MPPRKSKSSRAVSSRHTEIHLLDGLSRQLVLAPDEDPSEVEAFHAALAAELRVRTVVGRLILESAVRVQLEIERLARATQMLINARASAVMEIRLLQEPYTLTVAEAKALAERWALAEGAEQARARAEICALGLREGEVMAEAHLSLGEVLAQNRGEADRLERRRRDLLADLEDERTRAPRDIEDAEVIDDN